jgi:hypothetical protein
MRSLNSHCGKDTTIEIAGRSWSISTILSLLKKTPYRNWIEISWRFPEERDCLASFLALETAEVLAGVKPANLIRVANRKQICGRNLFLLWQKYGKELVRCSDLKVETLREKDESLLLLFYSPELLQRRLSSKSASAFLKRAGYDHPACLTSALKHLKSRVGENSVPHEIGVFLGYPLKDIAAFMGWADFPFACQRQWKIYGHSRRSVALADTFHSCRSQMACHLASSSTPFAFPRAQWCNNAGFSLQPQ